MTDKDTWVIIKRIDQVEQRLSKEIRELQSFRDRILGVTLVVSFVVSCTIELILKKIIE